MIPPHSTDHEAQLRAMIAAALRAADPRSCTIAGLRAHPPRARQPAVIAIGKGAPAMYLGYVEAAGDPGAGFILTTEGTAAPAWARVGDHPLPTARNAEHARALEAFVRSRPGDSFVVLLSGGSSALLSLPVDGLGLDGLRSATDALLRAGAGIRDLNTVRKHLERLKGGRLAKLMAPSPVDAYVLSDVIGDDLTVIGSGPLTPDPTTFGDALAILSRYGVRAPEAETCLRAGADGGHSETPKPGDPDLRGVRSLVVGSNQTALTAAGDEAMAMGLVPRRQADLEGDARAAGHRVARAIADHRPRGHRPVVLLWGGETTVNVGDGTGRGGRNQELALAAAIEIDGAPNVALAAFATDGVDGPTDAAGAIVTGETCARARGMGVDPQEALACHDSYTFFARAGGHLRTGPTGTNVNDLAIAIIG